MSDVEKTSDYGDIDESEEEALLRSDGEQTVETSEDEDEEDKLMKNYIEMLGKIDENKYNYENYLQLINIAHQLSDLEKVRQSCELFSSIYPLAPDIWLRWLKIERNLASSPTELQSVENLFRRALADYYSIDVALEFAQITFNLPEEAANPIWDELLSVYALHCLKGRQLYQLWRKYYEEKHPTPDKATITKIYRKELSLPLFDMEESYIEFKVFYEKNKEEILVDWQQIDKAYNRTKEDLQKMLPFENKLLELEPTFHQKRAELYLEYINEADNFADEAVLQIIYERMITECCLNAECWLNYIKYIEERGPVDELEALEQFPIFKQNSLDLVNRAIKNCTWSEKLHIKKMQIVEEMKLSKEDIKQIFESALEIGFQTPEPMVALWMEYLTILKRHTNLGKEKDVEILRANFDLAWNSLGRQWGVLADCDCQILQFWGKLEFELLGNFNKGRELWNTVMESADNASRSLLWLEFAQLESKKDIESARRIFSKALRTTTLDDPVTLANAWLRFERCYGSLDTQIDCQEVCDEVLTQYSARLAKKSKAKPESKPKIAQRKFEPGPSTPSKRKSETEASDSGTPIKKARQEEPKTLKMVAPSEKGKINESKLVKEHEDEEIDYKKDHLRIFLSNLDYNITEDEIKSELSELAIVSVDLIKTASGRGRGFGYLELSSEEEVNKALKLDRKMVKGRPLYVSSVLRDKEKRQKFKYSDGLEPCKLFVKGVPYDATKEELETLFGAFGKLKDVRIVYHKSGKPKGIAYVEFEEESAASAAVLKLDQSNLRDQKLIVAISRPPPRASKNQEGNITKLLGIGRSRPVPGVKGEPKPRMNLIPTSVINGSGSKPVQKTNDDFRKLLNK